MPTKKQSILFVITRGDSIGGAQIHVRDLAHGAQLAGRRVAVVVGSSGPFLSLLAEAGVEALLVDGLERSINPLSDLRAVGRLRRVIRDWKPDLVACHTAKAGLVGRLAAWMAGVPSQYTVHGWQFAEGISQGQRAIVLILERFLAGFCSRIITVSEADRTLALKKKVGKPEQIRTIHNGMAPVPVSENLRGGATIRLVMVARFQAQKDHATLFHALELLEALPWSLSLVGDGPDQNRWKTWVEQRGWTNRVEFVGYTRDVAPVLARSDVFVLASRWEGFPNSILEAMRAGLPVVSSDVGGVNEAVVHERTGLVVPKEDPRALANALELLLGDRDLRRRWGAEGEARFLQSFTLETMLKETMALWDAC